MKFNKFNTKKHFAICSIIFSLFVSSLFGEEELNYLNTSWSSVIPGEVIAEPAITSYGFCLATDGKIISAFSNEGTLLWEKSTKSSKNISITALPEDFVLLWDARDKKIKLLNPSGSEIWGRKLNYSLNKKPFPGRDGRFFTAGENIIECYGINGVRKWRIETGLQKDLPLQELPDGSIIVFLMEEGGKTKALRISPFGKIMEEITFAGQVQSAFTTKDGVFLIFTDGGAGMFSIIDNLSKNKWVIEKKVPDSTLVVSDHSYVYLELYSNKVVVNKIGQMNGEILFSFTIENINGLDLHIKRLTDGGLFLADSKNCYLYGLDGTKKWSALMPENSGSKSYNYVIYTNDNHLIFCLKNWSVNAYLTAQNLGKGKKSQKKNYNDFYTIDTTDMDFLYTQQLNRNVISEKRVKQLTKGDYAEDEIEFASDIYSIFTSYLEKTAQQRGVGRKNLSVFDLDSYGTEEAIKQLPLYGTSDGANYLGKLLNQTTNSSYQKVIFQSISICGYDPEGRILKSMENIIPKLNRTDLKLMESACDAVYAVCLFMGRPAFNRVGKEILKNLLYPQYDLSTRNYARETLEKIADLDL